MTEPILPIQGGPEMSKDSTSPEVEEDFNLDAVHQERVQLTEQANAIDRMRRKFPNLDWDSIEAHPSMPRSKKPQNGPTPPADPDKNVRSSLRGKQALLAAKGESEVASTVGREAFGLTIGAPKQVIGGGIDAVIETNNLAREFNDWMSETVGSIASGGIIVDSDGLRFASGNEIENTQTLAEFLLPEVDRPDSYTGNFVRDLSKFLVGFMGAGKISAVQKIGSPLARAGVQGAISDFTVFPAHEERLSDFLRNHAGLEDPVTEYLAADPADSAAEGRLKNAIEGTLFGGAAEVGVKSLRGLVSGLNSIRSARLERRRAGLEAVDTVKSVVETAEARRSRLHELTGDPEAPAIEIPQVDPPRAEGKPVPAEVLAEYPDLTPTPRAAEAPEVAQARDEVEAIKRMKVAELREAGLMPERGGRKRDLLEEAERRLGLVEEAKKFDTADEFIEAQGGILYHGTAEEFGEFDLSKTADGSIWFTSDRGAIDRGEVAASGAGRAEERVLRPGVKLASEDVADKLMDEQLIAKGYRGIAHEADDFGAWTRLFFPNEDTLTLRQMGDLFEQARPSRPGGMGTEEAAQAVDGSGEVFINWARIDSTEDIKAVTQELANAKASEIEGAQRGVRTWEETKLSADEVDAWEVLESRRKGDPLNAEQSVAIRELWIRSSKKVQELAEMVSADPSEINQIAFMRQMETHNFIQEGAIAARTEVARALNSWRIPVGDSVDFAGQFDQLRSSFQFSQDALEMAESIKLLSKKGMTEVDNFIYGSWKTKGSDMIRQLYYFSMLSGPHTHARNIGSAMLILPLRMAERKTANLLGRMMGEQNVPDGEALASFYGAMAGFRNAFRITAEGRKALRGAAEDLVARDPGAAADRIRQSQEEFGPAYRSAVTGETGIGVGKVELPRLGAFSTQKLGIDKNNPKLRPLYYLASIVDPITKSTTRALATADEVFKAMFYQSELHTQAFQKVVREVDEGKILPEEQAMRLSELTSNPDEAMRLAARFEAETSTFTNRPLDTKPWRAVQAVAKVPVLGKIVMPFRTTPYNIATFSFQRTPLAPLVKQFQNDLLEGGAKSDLAYSKLLLGNSVLALFADFAISGLVTAESPKHSGKRGLFHRMNKKPYSIRVQVGDDSDDPESYRNFSYRGIEPIAFPLGVAANIVAILEERDWDDEDKELEELVLVSSMAIANQLTSAQYMSGVSDFLNMMHEPERYAESYFSRLAGVTVPTGVAQIARFQDPNARLVNDWVSRIQSRIPGKSKDLPLNRDVWGRTLSKKSGLGSAYDFLSPAYSSKNAVEPIDIELERLGHWISKPSRTVSFDGVKVNFRNRPEWYSRYMELQGNGLKKRVSFKDTKTGKWESEELGLLEELNLLVTGRHSKSVTYARISDPYKEKMINKKVAEFRERARNQLLDEFPKLDALVEVKREQIPRKYEFQTGAQK